MGRIKLPVGAERWFPEACPTTQNYDRLVELVMSVYQDCRDDNPHMFRNPAVPIPGSIPVAQSNDVGEGAVVDKNAAQPPFPTPKKQKRKRSEVPVEEDAEAELRPVKKAKKSPKEADPRCLLLLLYPAEIPAGALRGFFASGVCVSASGAPATRQPPATSAPPTQEDAPTKKTRSSRGPEHLFAWPEKLGARIKAYLRSRCVGLNGNRIPWNEIRREGRFAAGRAMYLAATSHLNDNERAVIDQKVRDGSAFTMKYNKDHSPKPLKIEDDDHLQVLIDQWWEAAAIVLEQSRRKMMRMSTKGCIKRYKWGVKGTKKEAELEEETKGGFSVNASMLQRCFEADATKMAACHAWWVQKWGLPDAYISTEQEKRKNLKINDVFLALFPAKTREELMADAIRWEDGEDLSGDPNGVLFEDLTGERFLRKDDLKAKKDEVKRMIQGKEDEKAEKQRKKLEQEAKKQKPGMK